jgi:hypothetical protein
MRIHMDHNTSAEAARTTLAGLEAKRAEMAGRLAAIGPEKATIAFKAHTGDEGARDRLSVLNAEAGSAERELADIDSAIAEAKQHVAAADEAVQALRRRDTAKHQAALADDFEAAGAAATKALADFVEAFMRIELVATELRACGAHVPATLRPLMRDATQTALMKIGLEGRFLPPSERLEMASLMASMAADLRRAAQRTIRGANAALGAEKRRAA